MADETSFQVKAGQRQLFLDDLGIAEMDNLSRTLHQPSKKGAVIRPDVHNGESSVQTRSAPSWDPEEEVYVLWASNGAVYKSPDGFQWTRSGDYRVVDQEGTPFNVFHLLRDPAEDDPACRYKGLAGSGVDRTALYPIASSDGMTWRLLDVPPFPYSDEANLSLDPVEHQYVMALHGNAMLVSADFRERSEPRLIFRTDEEDNRRGHEVIEQYLSGLMPALDTDIPAADDPDWTWEEMRVYNHGAFPYEGMYIGMPAVYFRRGKRYTRCIICFTEIQLICSKDLTTWQRLGDRQPFISPSPAGSGAYDLSKNLPPSNAVVRGDELWFYYTGFKYQGSGRAFDPDRSAICLAVLRRDGFMSVDAGASPGTLVTRPFTVSGKKLLVNLNAYPDKDQHYWRFMQFREPLIEKYGSRWQEEANESDMIPADEGELRVEVLDNGGSVLAVSEPITGDQPRAEVSWQEGDSAQLEGREVSLRFTLRKGRFYSYWFE